MTTEDPIHTTITNAIGMSVVAQMAIKEGLVDDIEEIPFLSGEVMHKLLDFYSSTLGVRPDRTAWSVMSLLSATLAHPKNTEAFVKDMADLLWTILGDPKSGDPPVIYRKAAIAVHLYIVKIFVPSSNYPS